MEDKKNENQWDLKSTLKENGLSMTKFALMLNISRVTLNIARNEFLQNDTCKNWKCNILFSRISCIKKIDKVDIINEIEIANKLVENLNTLKDKINRKNVYTLIKSLEMLNLILENANLNSDLDNKKLDSDLHEISKKVGRYYDDNEYDYDKLTGKTVVESTNETEVVTENAAMSEPVQTSTKKGFFRILSRNQKKKYPAPIKESIVVAIINQNRVKINKEVAAIELVKKLCLTVSDNGVIFGARVNNREDKVVHYNKESLSKLLVSNGYIEDSDLQIAISIQTDEKKE